MFFKMSSNLITKFKIFIFKFGFLKRILYILNIIILFMLLLTSPLEQFELIPLTIWNSFYCPININSVTIALLLTISVIFLFFINLSVSKISYIIPNNYSVIIENCYNIVLNLVQTNVGKQGGNYFPFIFSIFIFILTTNLIGMFPFSFTITSHIAITFSMSLFIFLGINYIGILKYKTDFLTLFLPSGSSLLLALMLIPIELLSYMFRVVSLSVRLFANMMAGHTLLKVIIGFFWILVAAGNSALMFLSMIPIFALILLVGLEFAVAIIQAFVFTILVCFYLNDALNLH